MQSFVDTTGFQLMSDIEGRTEVVGGGGICLGWGEEGVDVICLRLFHSYSVTYLSDSVFRERDGWKRKREFVNSFLSFLCAVFVLRCYLSSDLLIVIYRLYIYKIYLYVYMRLSAYIHTRNYIAIS